MGVGKRAEHRAAICARGRRVRARSRMRRLPAVDGEPLFGYAAALLVVFGGSLLAAPLVAASAKLAIAATAKWSSAAIRLAASNLQAACAATGLPWRLLRSASR